MPALLLATATVLVLAGHTALPPIEASVTGGPFVVALCLWAALLLVLPAVTLGVDRELLPDVVAVPSAFFKLPLPAADPFILETAEYNILRTCSLQPHAVNKHTE